LRLAVPELVNCAVPNKWMSEQWGAAASQKLTWPAVTAVLVNVTVAVSVTTLPETTEVTPLPPDVTAKVVLVAGAAA